VGPIFYRCWPHQFHFSRFLSLSSTASLRLSLLSAISRPLHPRRQTEKYPTKQKQTEMQKIILSVLSDGQIHGHFTAKFTAMASTPSGQPDHTKPTTTRKLRRRARKLPPALAMKLRRRSARSCLRRWRGSFERDPREAASGAGAGYGGERGRERGGEDAVPFLGCVPAPMREGRTEEEKDRNGGDMSGDWWGKK
jgi:hypothetical protein